jgi:hypothetical protein
MICSTVSSERRSIMDEELYNSVKKLLPELDIIIENALPTDLHKVFAEYNFLTLFEARRPATPGGKMYARRIVNRWKKMGLPGESPNTT